MPRELFPSPPQTCLGLLNGVTILAVDDDPDTLEILRGFLEHAGARVVKAPSAGRARSLMSLIKPHLAIVDLMMPGEDGYHFIRHVRTETDGPHYPILVLSALDTFNSQTITQRLGVEGYLTKPMEPALLIAAVERILHPQTAVSTR